MRSRERSRDFKEAFIRRTAEARERRGLTQEEMATLLGLSQGTYKQYETRSLLPHRLIVPFCIATGVELAWLFTGKSETNVAWRASKKVRPTKIALRRTA